MQSCYHNLSELRMYCKENRIFFFLLFLIQSVKISYSIEMHNGLNLEYSLDTDLYHSYFSIQLRKRDINYSVSQDSVETME